MFIDEKEAAKTLCVPVATLRVWRVRGRGPAFYKAGANVRYDREEIIAWMKAQRHTSTSNKSAA